MRLTRPCGVSVMLLIGLAVAGCGTVRTAAIVPSSRLVHVPGSPAGKIVLSALGAQRIGIQTRTASVVRQVGSHGHARPSVTVPYSAVVYAPSGKTYVFSNPARLTYTEVPVTVDHIRGNVVFLARGPKPGTRIVTLGAEELYGVQTGVLAQT